MLYITKISSSSDHFKEAQVQLRTFWVKNVVSKGVRKGGGLELNLLELDIYKNCITFAKEINCFLILFAC